VVCKQLTVWAHQNGHYYAFGSGVCVEVRVRTPNKFAAGLEGSHALWPVARVSQDDYTDLSAGLLR